jgi:hypothetical protein
MDIPSMLIGAGLAMLLANVWLWFVLPRWRDRGRRRDQPECPHGNLVRLLERDGADSDVVMCLMCDEQLLAPTNGASSSAPPRSPGRADGRSR